MIISIIGNVDKRVVAYPLMRALAIQGRTAVITDDGSFKRLYLQDGNTGKVSNIDIIIENELTKNSEDKLDKKSEHIENILFISNNFVHSKSDRTIIVRGRDKSMSVLKDEDEEQEIDLDEDDSTDKVVQEDIQKVFEVIVSTEADKVKGLQVINAEDLKYLWDTEEHKEMIKVSKNLVKIVSPIVSSILDISKSEATKLINRDFVTVGK